MGGECRHAEMMVDIMAAAIMQATASVQQATLPIGRSAFRTHIGFAGLAAGAFSAGGEEGENNPVADREALVVLGPQRLDDARRFVAQCHRHGAGTIAVDHRQVRMAQARRVDSDEQLAAARWIEGQRRQFQRTIVGIGTGIVAGAVQHRCGDFHESHPIQMKWDCRQSCVSRTDGRRVSRAGAGRRWVGARSGWERA